MNTGYECNFLWLYPDSLIVYIKNLPNKLQLVSRLENLILLGYMLQSKYKKLTIDKRKHTNHETKMLHLRQGLYIAFPHSLQDSDRSYTYENAGIQPYILTPR
ncbi:hypothetical protein HHI36_011756 [Cryptolaemus montrouzieri]|uniref:Uncharacterized protein n=1 Tax=Cryptolaemus montrouzieri TaxID=559131 RepID=A0ABD2ND10_9CUCU